MERYGWRETERERWGGGGGGGAVHGIHVNSNFQQGRKPERKMASLSKKVNILANNLRPGLHLPSYTCIVSCGTTLDQYMLHRINNF